MQSMNIGNRAQPANQDQPLDLSSSSAVWAPAHHFRRIHDPSGFAWLNSLRPNSSAAPMQGGVCFGIDVEYLALDLLLWFPSEMVLAIPFLETVPSEYFLVCNAGGRRWWCFVVLRKGAAPTALVFDVDPSVLLVAGLGLRETEVDARTGAVSRGRDFGYPPNAAVLCPVDSQPVRYERLSPATREYFYIREVVAPRSERTSTDSWEPPEQPLGSGMMEVAIGTPAFGLRMRVNEDEGLIRSLDSLGSAACSPRGTR